MLRLSVTMSDGSVHNVSSTSAGGWTATTAANPVVYSHLFHVSITPLAQMRRPLVATAVATVAESLAFFAARSLMRQCLISPLDPRLLASLHP